MRSSGIAVAAIILLITANSAMALDTHYLEFTQPGSGRPFDPTWPPDGSTWHELFPTYCTVRTQGSHEDGNANGSIDVCEHLTLDGVRHHVDWIGPTIKLRGTGRQEDKYVEAASGNGRQFHYHEVYPTFCKDIETAQPIDAVCQEVYITAPPEDVGWWHVEAIETNIISTPVTPVDEGTWSKVKTFFRKIFG